LTLLYRNPWRWLLALALPLFVLDQVSKAVIVDRFHPPGPGYLDGVVVIDGFFDIVRIHNKGIAFGRFNNAENANIIFGVVAALALVFILIIWWRGGFPTKLSRLAATLLISGILGNLVDRLARGYVVDFLYFDLPLYGRFPAFNVADSCITVAACLLLISAFQKPPEEEGVASPGAPSGSGQPGNPADT
jgi:signal peptidase II